MYKIQKYKFEDRHKLYFSSDWHVFHDPKTWEVPIWKMRGWSSPEDAAEGTLKLINDTVPEDGILYYHGDMFLNATDEQCLEWLSKVKCRNINTLWGNHESQMYRIYKQEVKRQYGFDDLEVYPLRMNNVVWIGNHVEIQVGKKKIIMNHFPLRIHHGSHHASFHTSGHSHLNDPERRPEYPFGKCLDVGIDYGKIWTYAEIEDVMSTKDIHLIDHPR